MTTITADTATDTTTTTDTATETFPPEIVRGEEVGHEGISRSMEEYKEICLSCWRDEVRRKIEEEYEDDDDEEEENEDEDDDERRDLDKNPITDEEIFEHITTTREGSSTFSTWELDAENSKKIWDAGHEFTAVYTNGKGEFMTVGMYEGGGLFEIDVFDDEEDLNDYIEGLTD